MSGRPKNQTSTGRAAARQRKPRARPRPTRLRAAPGHRAAEPRSGHGEAGRRTAERRHTEVRGPARAVRRSDPGRRHRCSGGSLWLTIVWVVAPDPLFPAVAVLVPALAPGWCPRSCGNSDGAFFRLVKCTTSRPPLARGHRRNAPWAKVSASRSHGMSLSRSR